MRRILYAAFAALFILVAYLVLKPSPNMREVWFIPDWLGAWADRNWALRTAVPYFLLSAMWTVIGAGRRPPID